MKTLPAHWDAPTDGRQSPLARGICRGVGRLLQAYAYAPLSEVVLVEIKSGLEDFRLDQKWPQYREFCDRFFFAVGPAFPRDVLPPDTGLIVADRYGGDILRPAPEHKLPATRRRTLILTLARTAAMRLQAALDPDGSLETLPRA